MTDTAVLTITDFLLARIAEDEDPETAAERFGVDRFVDMSRVLAECGAKRRIVEMYAEHDHSAYADHRWSNFAGGYATATDHVVALLAAVYDDHPDYDEGWRVV